MTLGNVLPFLGGPQFSHQEDLGESSNFKELGNAWCLETGVCVCNPSSQDAEAEEQNSKISLATQGAPPQLYNRHMKANGYFS